MMCPKCGMEIKEGEKFCKGCGSQILISQNNNQVIPQINSKKESKEKIKYWTIPIIMFFLGIFLTVIALLFDGIIGENNILSKILGILGGLSTLLSFPTFLIAFILEIIKNKNYWGIPVLLFCGGIAIATVGVFLSNLIGNDIITLIFTSLASLCMFAIWPSIIVVIVLKIKNKNK